MSFGRGVDDSQTARRDSITRFEQERRATRSGRLAGGTLACPCCDAPVALGAGPLSLADTLSCPFCANRGPVRDFLSLALPTRPARVEVRVTLRRASAEVGSIDP